MTTYYPAPAGSYQSMRSTKMCVGDKCHDGTAAAADNDLYVQGNVGIGTAIPTASLHVFSAAGIPAAPININSQAPFKISDNSSKGILMDANQIESVGGPLYFNHRSPTQNIIMVDNGGNVGIGVSNPDDMLEVAGSAEIRGITKAKGGLILEERSGSAPIEVGRIWIQN